MMISLFSRHSILTAVSGFKLEMLDVGEKKEIHLCWVLTRFRYADNIAQKIYFLDIIMLYYRKIEDKEN